MVSAGARMIERDAERNYMDHETQVTDLMTAQYINVEALFEIATESQDASIVRRAIAGLQATPAGRAYLSKHPLAE